MGPLTMDLGPGSDMNTCFAHVCAPKLGEKKNGVRVGKEEWVLCMVTGMRSPNPGSSQSQRRALDGDPG